MDQEHEIDINFGLESYPGEGTLTIPSRPTCFSHKLRLQDQSKRKLQLAVNVTAQQGSGLKVCGKNYNPTFLFHYSNSQSYIERNTRLVFLTKMYF